MNLNNEVQYKFVSQDNKRLLWEIMIENDLFNGIPDKYANNVKADFENRLKQMSGNILSTDSILDANKKIIVQMIEDIKNYTKPEPMPVPVPVPITSAEALSKKQAQFQKGLQSRQEEFTSLIQPIKPTTIDFSDKLDDEPIGSEMDIKLSQTIAWREKQLSQVLEKQDTNEASEWINNGKKVNSNTSASTSASANTSNHIKIGDVTNIDENNIISLKKVSFSEDNSLVDKPRVNFMDKLKKKDTNEDSTIFKNSLNVLTGELALIKTDLTFISTGVTELKSDLALIKSEISKILAENKSFIENQEKIMDQLEQIAFQVGSI